MIMSSKISYSLWLIPPKEALDLLKEIITGLSIRHNSTIFEPHIGLVSSVPGPVKYLSLKVEKVFCQIKPFSVTLSSITYFDQNPGGLFFKVKRNKDLEEIIKRVKKKIPYKEKPYKIYPHLTITYTKLKQENKEELLKELKTYKNITFKVQSVYLVMTSGEPHEWKKIKKFDLTN